MVVLLWMVAKSPDDSRWNRMPKSLPSGVAQSCGGVAAPRRNLTGTMEDSWRNPWKMTQPGTTLHCPKKTLVTCYFSMIYVGLYEWQWHKIWPLTLCFVFDFGAVSLLQLLASNEQQFGSTRFARHSEF